jgi:hypothetical protein
LPAPLARAATDGYYQHLLDSRGLPIVARTKHRCQESLDMDIGLIAVMMLKSNMFGEVVALA